MALSGRFLVVTRPKGTKTKKGKALSKDAVVRAVGEPEAGADAWVPIVFQGLLDHVRRADVQRIQTPRVAKPTPAQIAARRRLLKKRTSKPKKHKARPVRRAS